MLPLPVLKKSNAAKFASAPSFFLQSASASTSLVHTKSRLSFISQDPLVPNLNSFPILPLKSIQFDSAIKFIIYTIYILSFILFPGPFILC